MNNLKTKNFNDAFKSLKTIEKFKKVSINNINELPICHKANLVHINAKNEASLSIIGKEVLKCKTKIESYIMIIENFINYQQPDWIYEIHKGIENAKINLPNNFITIFESLGLFNSENRDVILWWNKQKTFKRNYEDQQRSIIGLKGEFLICDFEKKRTGISPSHMSINDDSLGYDILSIKEKKSKQAIMIEVKHCKRKDLRFFITENEFKQCENFQDKYFFYLIHSIKEEKKILYIFKYNDIIKHLPKNTGLGSWKNVEVKPNKSFLNKCKKHKI